MQRQERGSGPYPMLPHWWVLRLLFCGSLSEHKLVEGNLSWVQSRQTLSTALWRIALAALRGNHVSIWFVEFIVISSMMIHSCECISRGLFLDQCFCISSLPYSRSRWVIEIDNPSTASLISIVWGWRSLGWLGTTVSICLLKADVQSRDFLKARSFASIIDLFYAITWIQRLKVMVSLELVILINLTAFNLSLSKWCCRCWRQILVNDISFRIIHQSAISRAYQLLLFFGLWGGNVPIWRFQKFGSLNLIIGFLD